MNQNAPCKLCGKTAKLIKKSHIIPKFMYDGIRGANHQMIVKHFKDNLKPENWPSGIHERYILCSACEGLLGKYENHVAAFFNGNLTKKKTITINIKHDPSGELDTVVISDLDYNAFKLCFISILWRSHISQNKFFAKVDCSSIEKQLREIILSNVAPKDSVFKLAIFCVQGKDGHPVQFAVDPAILTLGGYKVALFLVSGYLYFMEIEETEALQFITSHYLKESGEMTIRILRGNIARTMLESLNIPVEWLDYFTPNHT